MKYHYSKSKFSNQLFFKSIQLATLEHTSGIFQISVVPYFHYSGKYHIHSVVQKDKKRTLFLTMKSQENKVNFDELNPYNKFFVSLSHDGKKAMIFTDDANGIILKS
jgi:hypothetical protein